MVRLRVALNTETKPFEVEVEKEVNVGGLKGLICREKEINMKTHRVRLILAGKLLDDDERGLTDFALVDGST
eukprot:CAMPEP_0184679060 /NCGR_PEP_ID=MMETSP0312-20130426/1889_1 /TAXON_ID=31354 /ORGANISM="Compsopogon coeruleus, Strain SAG 36.94" /LENGTH=71 /DNA_ID=CAMNT_0027128267 /DNA_START=173 /DNA_END=385 /DNA_ORIENTATION=-